MYIVILLFLGIAITWSFIKVCADEKSAGFMAIIFFLYIVFIISLLSHNASTPSAMDVYSGKTELRYTVQGGEITDSVVVYKNKQN